MNGAWPSLALPWREHNKVGFLGLNASSASFCEVSGALQGRLIARTLTKAWSCCYFLARCAAQILSACCWSNAHMQRGCSITESMPASILACAGGSLQCCLLQGYQMHSQPQSTEPGDLPLSSTHLSNRKYPGDTHTAPLLQISLDTHHAEREDVSCCTASSSLVWRERHCFLLSELHVQRKVQCTFRKMEF